jgi:hypothetical protein
MRKDGDMASPVVVELGGSTDLAITFVAGDPSARPPDGCVVVPDPAAAARHIHDRVEVNPRAARAVVELIAASLDRSPWDALYAESIAYSSLLGGPEFDAWRTANPAHDDPAPTAPAAIVDRAGDVLSITLNRPERRNAMSRWVRDATCDALDIAVLDPSITQVRLSGHGPSFCSGGDLDEFGANPDVRSAHFVRLDRSVGWRVHLIADRVVAEVHGACVGAGIEIPAFAGRVVAREGAWFELPELSMGLLPGAGGTVSLPRRIGPSRSAWLALSGERIDVATALAWGLVDARVD